MLAKAISPELSLSEQISVSDVKTIAELGFKSIICNRPDSEGPDQPTFEEIRAAWFLKEKLLPPLYWNAMLRGHEWMAEPQNVTAKTE